MFAKRLFSFFPLQEAGDPEVVLAGVVQLFEYYPAEIVERALHPKLGLPGRSKYLPRVAEIREFLDEAMEPIRREQHWQRICEDMRALPAPERPRRTYQELVAYCASQGVTIGPKKKTWGEREIAEFRKANNISDEVWNAIPDAK